MKNDRKLYLFVALYNVHIQISSHFLLNLIYVIIYQLFMVKTKRKKISKKMNFNINEMAQRNRIDERNNYMDVTSVITSNLCKELLVRELT